MAGAASTSATTKENGGTKSDNVVFNGASTHGKRPPFQRRGNQGNTVISSNNSQKKSVVEKVRSRPRQNTRIVLGGCEIFRNGVIQDDDMMS